ncbi:FAD-dependent oxidoreductase [Streptomyces sp. NPDC006173]|uniref:FAD-dependent oxidoreductase n=1 Tax=Streptomyces sp. NPDC006173 TaxID=3155349 RepID=UPI0034114F13
MNRLPDVSSSYWMQTVGMPVYPSLTAPAEADVIVVGAGIAGLSTAWELSRVGLRVIVLEAARIAAGVTGHTTGKITALHTSIYGQLRSQHGEEAARLYATSQSTALGRIMQAAEELGTDCELERRPAYTYCEDPNGVQALKKEAEAARQAGLSATFVTETDLPYPVGGAVRVEDQAQFHPLKYLRALADDLTARGSEIYENTRVTDLDEGEPCRVTTSSGIAVTAGHVVVATHHPVFDHALLSTRLTQHRDLVIAGPIPADQDPNGMYITSEDGKRSVRTAPGPGDERLLIITGEAFTPGTGEDTAARYTRLLEWAEQRFPGFRTTYRWAAQDNSATDTVPLIGLLHPGSKNVYTATGFAGWGMTGGVLAGQLLTSLITGAPRPPWAEFYDPRRLRSAVRTATAPAFLKAQWDTGKHFVKDRLDTLGDGSNGPVATLPPGEGTVVRAHGRPCAVHRDGRGDLHAVSAVCTHLGCLVAFNNAERTWECPCHGSRFGIDGQVLQGPALRPLEPQDTDEL